MKVLIQPQRPVEYWMLIRDLKLGIELLERTIRILVEFGSCSVTLMGQDVNGNLAAEVEEMKSLLTATIQTACEKYNVLPPDDRTCPTGKESFMEWDERMKAGYWQERYKKIICSACPFGLGWKAMSSDSKFGWVPCYFFLKRPGSSFHIPTPLVMPNCAAIGHSHVKELSSLDGLRTLMLKPAGECLEAIQLQYPERNWQAFTAKIDQLKKLAVETSNTNQTE